MEQNPPINILLVDDKPANLLALEAVLGKAEYDLIRAHSGYEAVKLVEQQDFAVILLDVQMPGMDGYETAARIKGLPRGKDVPIVFITAVFKEDEDVRRGYAAGGLDFFPKPLIPEILRAKVRIYADLYRMTREAGQHRQLMSAIKERQAAERTLDALLGKISEGVIIADAAGNITRSNEAARRIWGGARPAPLTRTEKFAGRWVETGKNVRPDEWALPRVLKSGVAFMSEPIEIKCFDGSCKTILESACALKDGERIVGVVVIIESLPATHSLPALPTRTQSSRNVRRFPEEGLH